MCYKVRTLWVAGRKLRGAKNCRKEYRSSQKTIYLNMIVSVDYEINLVSNKENITNLRTIKNFSVIFLLIS